MIAPSSMLYVTARIVAKQSAKPESVGTAFFFIFDQAPGGEADLDNHFLITNKHVIAEATELQFRLNQGVFGADGMRVPNGLFTDVTLNDSKLTWLEHPNADLCPPVSEKLSPPPRSGVRASHSQGA